MTRDKNLDLIRTLLTIANGGSPYPAERQRAQERAERLMARHNIDAATATLSDDQAREPICEDFQVEGSYALDRIVLLGTVYTAFGCRALRTSGSPRVIVYGFAQDVAMASTLADSLEAQMVADMAAYGGNVSAKKAFCASFAATVGDRLKQFYADALVEAEAEGTGSAVVLADRESRVDAVVKRDHPNVRQARARTLRDPYAWQAGAKAGERADIALDERKVRQRRALPSA